MLYVSSHPFFFSCYTHLHTIHSQNTHSYIKFTYKTCITHTRSGLHGFAWNSNNANLFGTVPQTRVVTLAECSFGKGSKIGINIDLDSRSLQYYYCGQKVYTTTTSSFINIFVLSVFYMFDYITCTKLLYSKVRFL